MIYRSLFARAWKVTWNHGLLWFFGLGLIPLMLLGEFRPLVRFFWNVTSDPKFLDIWVFNSWPVLAWEFTSNLVLNAPLRAIALGLFLIVLLGIAYWICFVCQGLVITLIDQINNRRPVDVIRAVVVGLRRSPHTLAINLAMKAGIGALVAIVAFPLVKLAIGGPSSESLAASSIFILFAVAIYLPLAIMVNFLTNFAVSFNVLYRYDWIQSLKGAFRLFRRHWLESLEWGLLLLAFDVIWLTAVFMLCGSLFNPYGSLSVLQFYLGSFWTFAMAGTALLVAAAAIGWLMAFHQAVWVLLFEHFTANSPAAIISKIVRVAKSIAGALASSTIAVEVKKDNDQNAA